MKKTILPLLLTTAPIFAGEPAPIIAPPPACDCPQGFTAGLELLALRPYQSEGSYNENDFDLGLRGSLGYEFGDCLFVKLTGFGYETDVFDGLGFIDGGDAHAELEVAYVDLVIGQHFTQCDKLTLSPYVGLRWASFEEEYTESFVGSLERLTDEFDGIGVVVGIDAVRSLGSNFSVYGTAKQSVVFGETDRSDIEFFDTAGQTVFEDETTDDVVFISELGLGVQYDFAFSNVAANVRAGVEGQWWAGPSFGDSENAGLAGFVLGANFRF